MQGFKPKTHKPQHLAGGGIVDSLKGMLGFKPEDPERAKRLAEYRANQEREKQAKQAQAKPAEKAISRYSGDSALQRRMKEVDSYKDGGMIRGKGTGTSDSIPRGFKPGTFIMPADSTKAIGPERLERMGKVPTKVSNGEFAHTPEQVHAVGIDTLNRMKDATHKPVDEKINQALYLANGGEVENDVLRVGNSYSGGNVGGNITVNGSAPAGAGPQAIAPVAAPLVAPIGQPPAPVAAPVAATVAATPANPAAPGVTPSMPAVPVPPVNSFTARNAAVSASSITNNGGRFDQGQQQPVAPVTPDPVIPERKPVIGFANGGEVRGFKPDAQRLVNGGGVLDEQAKRDRERLAKLAAGVGNANQNAGRAILDVATMIPRGVAGAYDSAVVRPMRAVGINAGYLSPKLVPDGVDPASMTPFADQKRMREQSVAGAGRGLVNPPVVAPVSAGPAVPDTLTDVQRGGALAQAPTDTAVMAQQAVQAAPLQTPPVAAAQAVAQGAAPIELAPVEAKGFQAPTVRHSGNDWQARNDLRNARVSASSITANGGRFDQTRKGQMSSQNAAYAQALAVDAAMRGEEVKTGQQAMALNQGAQGDATRQNAENNRTVLREQGFRTRDQRKAGMDERALAMQETAAGFSTRAAAQAEQLRGVLLDPSSTPAQRQAAQQAIIALSGKESSPKDSVVTLGGGQEWDSNAGAMRNVPQRAIDLRTGQEIGGKQAAAVSASPYSDGQELKGKDGKTYVVKNGVPVLK